MQKYIVDGANGCCGSRAAGTGPQQMSHALLKSQDDKPEAIYRTPELAYTPFERRKQVAVIFATGVPKSSVTFTV